MLRYAGASLLPTLIGVPTWAQEAPARANDFWLRPRRIRLTHASGEKIESLYWSDGQLILPAYEELSFFMRDRVVHQGVYMSLTLLDILYGVGGWLEYFGVKSETILTSGYRDPVRSLSIEGAVKDGPHTKGEAGDIVIPGVNSLQTAKFGLWLGGGGVGWYPGKRFVHVDKGRVRSWRG
jgi:uncharacterized protein YcbK (DUF882 family)